MKDDSFDVCVTRNSACFTSDATHGYHVSPMPAEAKRLSLRFAHHLRPEKDSVVGAEILFIDSVSERLSHAHIPGPEQGIRDS